MNSVSQQYCAWFDVQPGPLANILPCRMCYQRPRSLRCRLLARLCCRLSPTCPAGVWSARSSECAPCPREHSARLPVSADPPNDQRTQRPNEDDAAAGHRQTQVHQRGIRGTAKRTQGESRSKHNAQRTATGRDTHGQTRTRCARLYFVACSMQAAYSKG